MPRDLPTIQRLRERLLYEPDTGRLFWQAHPDLPDGWNTRYAGTPALAARNRGGYGTGAMDGCLLSAHIVAWAMHHGRWPERDIDHEDHDRVNNRISNLKEVGRLANNRNALQRRDNSSGVTGVRWHTKAARWQARITTGGRDINLGFFDAFDAAVAARKVAETEHGYHPNHGVKG